MNYDKTKIYFREFGIIDKAKQYFRSFYMSKEFYLVVIDTTESRQLRNVQRGIIGSYVVKAFDEENARQIILRTFNSFIAEQVQYSFYIYPLDDILYNIDLADENKKFLPLYSFLPLNGTRPPKVLNLPKRPLDKKSEEKLTESVYKTEQDNEEVPTQKVNEEVPTQKVNEEVIQKKETRRVVAPPQVNVNNKKQLRSHMFNERERVRTTTNDMDNEKMDIIRRLGAQPTHNGADEGVNLKINASTGRNLNQTSNITLDGPDNEMTSEQLEIINRLGVQGNEEIIVNDEPDVDNESLELAKQYYSEISGVPSEENGGLSQDELLQLQEEYKELKDETGFDPGDSNPMNF